MQSNNPKTITIEVDGEPKEIILDRIGIQMFVNPIANINAPIKQAVDIRFKRCSADGWLFNEDVSIQIPDLAACDDVDILTCFAEIEASLTKLVNKKGNI